MGPKIGAFHQFVFFWEKGLGKNADHLERYIVRIWSVYSRELPPMKWFWQSEDRERFRDYERMVLDTVKKALPPTLQSIFEEHIESVNLVQRHGKGREVNMYRMVHGSVTVPTSQLTSKVGDTVVGTAILEVSDKGPRPVGKVWAVSGHVFQIMFNANEERLRLSVGVALVQLGQEFTGLTPMIEPSDVDLIPGLVLSNVLPKLSESRCENAIRSILTSLPDDYLELARRTDGYICDEWKVLGLEDVYETPGVPGAYVLAEYRSPDPGCCDLALITQGKHVSCLQLDDLTEDLCEGEGFVSALRDLVSKPRP